MRDYCFNSSKTVNINLPKRTLHTQNVPTKAFFKYMLATVTLYQQKNTFTVEIAPKTIIITGDIDVLVLRCPLC